MWPRGLAQASHAKGRRTHAPHKTFAAQSLKAAKLLDTEIWSSIHALGRVGGKTWKLEPLWSTEENGFSAVLASTIAP